MMNTVGSIPGILLVFLVFNNLLAAYILLYEKE